MDYGVQMYSLREQCKDAAGMERGFEQIAKMGATVAEICYGDNISAKEYAKISKNTGIRICSSHSNFNRIEKDIEALTEEHLIMGSKIIGIGGMPGGFSRPRTKSNLKKFCEIYNKAAQYCEKYDVKLAYHNHTFEFKNLIFGNVLLDELMDNTSENIQLCLDACWAYAAGSSAQKYLNKYGARVGIIHLKDYKKDGKKGSSCCLGDGEIDFKSIVDLAKQKGTAFAVIEDESNENQLESVEKGFIHLNKFIK